MDDFNSHITKFTLCGAVEQRRAGTGEGSSALRRWSGTASAYKLAVYNGVYTGVYTRAIVAIVTYVKRVSPRPIPA